MSNSDPAATTSLKINLIPPEGADAEDIDLVVYDGWDQPVFQGAGNAALNLATGLYTVRWSYAGILQERVVRVPQVRKLDLRVKRRTPAPVPDAVDTHEYYSAYNGDISDGMNTGDPLGQTGTQDSRLYILIRPHQAEEYRGQDVAAGLRLLDANLSPIFDLGQRSLKENSGLLLCTLLAEAGYYFLEFSGKSDDPTSSPPAPRLFPIHLFPGWQTRLYMFYENSRPNFASASLSMLRMDVQSSYSSQRRRADAAADMALNSLQNNTQTLPKEIERGLLHGKFENPLLGLLGAHFLLQHSDSRQENAAEEARLRDLARQLFYNLDDLLPHSPDVLALRFKAALRFPQDPLFQAPSEQLSTPPLLRASLEALMQAESQNIPAILDGSLLEQLAPNLYYDSPWASYRPPAHLSITKGDSSLEMLPSSVTKSPSGESVEAEHWMVDTVRQALELTSRFGHEPNWNNLATNLGIPLRKMKSLVDKMR